MAESIVVYLVDKLTSLISKEANLIAGVEEQVVSLRDELRWMQCVVRDADKKRRTSPLVNVWVTDLTDLAYDAEDVIDAYVLHLERRSQTASWFCFPAPTAIIGTPILHSLGKKIEKINSKARAISARKSDYDLQLSDPPQNSMAQNALYRRKGVPTVKEEFHVVGLQQESAELGSWLMSKARQRQVISIVGMGGLGKTTLAQKVYKDFTFNFVFKIWITVSQEFQVRDLLLSSLKQITHSDHSLLDTGHLKEKIYEHLDNQTYFMVMDDIWMVDAWEQISGAFPNNQNGSRVLLTSRNKEVALRAASSNCLELRLLNKDESWELFCRKVFMGSGRGCPPELTKLGEAIVDRCRGLPLAILVIGGLLMGKDRTPNAWSRVLDTVNWHLSQDSNECRQILILSYIDLPYALKLCFLHLGLFPEDYKFRAKRLLRLWAAEGFVEGRGDQTMEDVAEDYLEELIQRSMIQAVHRWYHCGSVLHCRVHDLLRDVAITEGRKDRFLDIYGNSITLCTRPPRRLAFHPSGNCDSEQPEQISTSPTNLQHPRSLMIFDESFKLKMYLKLTFGDGKSMLRVLDLDDVKIGKCLPKEIGRLVSLSYLRVTDGQMDKLPSSVGGLVKLQTLDVQRTAISSLPKEMWRLKSLRHLLLSSKCYEFRRPTSGGVPIDDFSRDLHTLKVNGFFPMKTTISKYKTGLPEFLVTKRLLQSLMIDGEFKVNNDELRNCFPSSLTELHFWNTNFEHDPSDILKCLPNLKVLMFGCGSYIGLEMVFSSGGFLQLQCFCIDSETLQEWRLVDGAIPSLTHLEIRCPHLNQLPDELRHVRTLQKIELQIYNLKESLKENGKEWDKIKHIPLKGIN